MLHGSTDRRCLGVVGELEDQSLPTPGGVWSQYFRWEPQGGPCALSPHGASLRHVNENKYGDCDIHSP